MVPPPLGMMMTMMIDDDDDAGELALKIMTLPPSNTPSEKM